MSKKSNPSTRDVISMKYIISIVSLALFLAGCSVSTRMRVYDDPPTRTTTSSGDFLAVTKPALCNDYPVEYRKSGSSSELTMANIDFWFLASKPNPCRKQPTVDEPKSSRGIFRRFKK